ncbi:hypothetical protein CLV30_106261 [Haloactinopolyspora alba]|uniref:Tetrapyrrole biosynthesis glutamyl-tRNA reductase dimerisation domain-containing protein n=1 Tax=Haloactinopolyspora alba TaxID=648780 RepID=A0A2P8E449_9ACTN|nr:hypothetical protein [Haloactinopolyspora alba]PSL04255.1 hypothetical protein CLV30_106261 [Haloactinopolyspora alba]
MTARHVLASLDARCAEVVDAELDRLRRRRPDLGEHELGVVSQQLRGLADDLVLRPVMRHPEHARAVEALFALVNTETRQRGST